MTRPLNHHPVSFWLPAALGAVFYLLTATGQGAVMLSTRGLQMWLDASSIDGAGNASFSSDGQAVATWVNLSPDTASIGNFTSGATSPTYYSDVLGGSPVVRFDGSLMTNSFTLADSGSASLTIFAVANDNASGNQSLLATRRNNPGVGDSGWVLRGQNQNTSWYFNTGDTSSVATNSLDTTGFNLIEVVRDGAGGPGSIRLSDNGGTPATATHTPAKYKPAEGGTGLGGQPGNTDLWIGDVAEVIVYDRVLARHESNVIGGYLSRKYALPSDYVLDVDFGDPGSTVGTQAGFKAFEFADTAGPVARTFDSRLGRDGSVTVGLSVTSTDANVTSLALGTRDRGAISGAFASQSDLLGSHVFANAAPQGKGFETLLLTLSDLAFGQYEITLFHHDRNYATGQIDLLLDDATGSAQLMISALEQSTGSNPEHVATSTLRFLAGVDPVVIYLREIDGTAPWPYNETAVLNGFMLTAVPEPGTWLLLLCALACGLLVRRRR